MKLPFRGGGGASVKNAIPMFASVGLALPAQFERVEELIKSKVAAAGTSLRQRALKSPMFFAHVSGSMTASATSSSSSSTTIIVSRVADISVAQEARLTLNKSKSKLRPASEAELEAAFNAVDKNRSGDIDRDELQAACASLGGVMMKDAGGGGGGGGGGEEDASHVLSHIFPTFVDF